jgi:hypothetical protein
MSAALFGFGFASAEEAATPEPEGEKPDLTEGFRHHGSPCRPTSWYVNARLVSMVPDHCAGFLVSLQLDFGFKPQRVEVPDHRLQARLQARRILKVLR